MSPLIYIDREAGAEAPDDDSFSCWVTAALKAADEDLPNEPEVSIRINDTDEMIALNGQYRGKSGPTNVLSFPAELPPDVVSGLLGDIVICAPVVIREASEQQKSIDSHWAHMTVHGVLHLLGYDHIEEAEAEQMEQLEIRILDQLGYPNPYDTFSEQRAAIP